jgi:hypothetical protein
MGNVLVLDESSIQDGSLFCFAGIVFKDHYCYEYLRNKLDIIKRSHEVINGMDSVELKGSNLGPRIANDKKTLIINLFGELKQYIFEKECRVLFYIMHKNDFKMNNIDLERVLNKVIVLNSDINIDYVYKYLYYPLSAFLIYKLQGLSLPNDFIEEVICDNVYNLINTSHDQVTAYSNLTNLNIETRNLIPYAIQAIHNNIFKVPRRHEGFNSLSYCDSSCNILIQLCDLIANFLINSIRYKFYELHQDEKTNTYRVKYDILNNFFDMSNLPLNKLPIIKGQEDIICTKPFSHLFGEVNDF